MLKSSPIRADRGDILCECGAESAAGKRSINLPLRRGALLLDHIQTPFFGYAFKVVSAAIPESKSGIGAQLLDHTRSQHFARARLGGHTCANMKRKTPFR